LYRCVIKSLCSPNVEFQKVNPTTQIALFSYCVNECPEEKKLIWNIYFGRINSTQNFTKWILFEQMTNFENIWFFGRNTTDFTSTNDLFVRFRNETHWKFEVIYQFERMNSSSALNFEINPPPSNGSCEINPQNGTTNTLFNITCSHWKIEENIKEYSLFTRNKQIIAFSPKIPSFEVRLPIGNPLDLFVEIRDYLDGITQFNLSSVTVTKESFSSLLSSNLNQNEISQTISLITEEFNEKESETIDKAISNGIPLSTISVSSLLSQVNLDKEKPKNESAQFEFLKEINEQANRREDFIKSLTDLPITSASNLKLQSLSLVQLTSSTNQLTRTSLTLLSEKCFELTKQLQIWLEKMPFEDVQMIVTQLLQCATNLLTAVNGPLQKRIEILEKDSKSAIESPQDYETDLEFETLEKGRIFYFQKKLADSLNDKLNQIIFILTSSLNLHLNLGQNYSIETPQVFLSLQTISLQSLLTRMNLSSSNLNPNQTVSFRVRFALFLFS